MNLKNTGSFIAQRRKSLGLTQENLAQSLDITAKAVSKWERGLSFPDIALLNNLSVALKCSATDLINGKFSENDGSNIKPEYTVDDCFGSSGQDNIILDPASEKYVSPFLFGSNLEHTRSCINSGISAQMLKNRKFAGKPERNGCAHEWEPIGERLFIQLLGHYFGSPPCDTYTHHAENRHMLRYNECNVLRLTAAHKEIFGIKQKDLYIEKNREYIFSVALKPLKDCNMRISVTDIDGDVLFAESVFVEGSEAFLEKSISFSCESDCEQAVLRITFDTENTVFIGSASLMPYDNFYGMRRDVIELMKQMGISVLRWPGGNFAGDYNWKDGLLPRNMRAPIQSYLGLETQPNTMGYDFHEINTDDFIMLCREIGAEPFITINPTWNTPEESAQWVEYCNGDQATEYGRLRISRGFKESHNVKFWSLGNEFGYGHMEGLNTAYEYSKTVRQHAEAMLKVSPYLAFCSSGPYPSLDWIKHSAQPLSDISQYVSLHKYINYPEFTSPDSYKEEYESFIKATGEIKQLAASLRGALGNEKIRISFDEWNSWYAWYRPESVSDGIFAACVLHTLINSSESFGIDIACHFEAVNEGAIKVDKKSAWLTPMGVSFAVMKNHSFGKLLFGSDETVITENDGKITATLINTSYDERKEYKLPICKSKAHGILYFSDSVLPHSRFSEEKLGFITRGGCYLIELPPHSISLFIQE